MTRAVDFSPRQLEVIRLIARGFTSEEIGVELGIAARTAKVHADTVRLKLGVKRRREVPEAFMRLTGVSPYPQVGAAA